MEGQGARGKVDKAQEVAFAAWARSRRPRLWSLAGERVALAVDACAVWGGAAWALPFCASLGAERTMAWILGAAILSGAWLLNSAMLRQGELRLLIRGYLAVSALCAGLCALARERGVRVDPDEWAGEILAAAAAWGALCLGAALWMCAAAAWRRRRARRDLARVGLEPGERAARLGEKACREALGMSPAQARLAWEAEREAAKARAEARALARAVGGMAGEAKAPRRGARRL